jgi:predicted RNase H-like HicB family nuclease
MKIKVVIHEAEEGGYWAEVPSIPGCATQGETLEELTQNLEEAIQACLAVEVEPPEVSDRDRVVELAV